MHSLNQRLNIPPLRLRPTNPLLRIPRIILIPLPLQLLPGIPALADRPLHDAVDVAFHGLFVEAIEAEAVRGGRARGAGFGDLLYGVEGVDEDAVCGVLDGGGMEGGRD